jgi:hypothetical protein
MSVLSADGGPTSPCNSIIAAFPSPPELQAEERAEYEQALALALQPSYFAPTHPGLTRVRDQRPQSDAFSFDDDYWLNHEEDTPRAEVPATRPLRVVTDGKPAKSSNSPLSGPPTQAPSLQLPELLSNPYGKCASLDSIIHDINQLIEHARPESVTIPDFASLHREGHANYDQEILASPSSRPASHIFPLDQREKRSETPTSRAARNEALLALESLASAAGYRLVRQSYVSQREDL